MGAEQAWTARRAWIVAGAALLAGAPAAGQGMLSPGGRPATSALVLAPGADAGPGAPAPVCTGAMADRVAGIAARLDPPALRRLRGALLHPNNREGPRPEVAGETWHVTWRLRLEGPAGAIVVAIERSDAGAVGLAGDGHWLALDPRAFRDLALGWPMYAGDFETGSGVEPMPGQTAAAGAPLLPSLVRFDTRTARERLANGRAVRVAEVSRRLVDETIWVRVPRGYSARSPAGVLIWVDAGPSGRPPAAFGSVLDELGLVSAGAAAAGNDRAVNDRYQLALDALATVEARYHVDPERVYLAGISGGARVASTLWGCFPDLAQGCVAIVGLSVHAPVPAGGGKVWPPDYEPPAAALGALLRRDDHRLAALTGPLDFNYAAVAGGVEVLRGSGRTVRLFEHADLAHEMPSAERLAEALRWVDEPARTRRAALESRGRELLDEVMARDAGSAGGGGRATDKGVVRRGLERVVVEAPWTAAAWAALEQLRSGAGAPELRK